MSNGWNRKALVGIALSAGAYARAHQHTLTTEAMSLKSDQTLVTKIDTEVERQIKAALLAIAPASHIIGEESIKEQSEEYIESALRGECWIIDPIDGTVPFAFGFDTWGVSIGYMVGGVITDGVIYLPASGLLIISDGDRVYCGVGTTEETINLEPLERRPSFDAHGIISISQDIACLGVVRTSHSVHSIGSCVYSVARYLRGAYRGVVTNVKLWDIAAGIPLLQKAGHTMLLQNGEAVRGDTTYASFLTTAQPNQHRRWAIRSHMFIAPQSTDCQALINATTIRKY